MKIIFVENTKIYSRWASKTYEYKMNNIRKNASKFIFVDIGAENYKYPEEYLDPTNGGIVIIGWTAQPISKYYTFRRKFYSNKIKDLEDKQTINERLKPFFEYQYKFQMVQDLHDNDMQGGIEGLMRYLVNNKFTGVITPYKSTPMIEKLKLIPRIRIIFLCHHIDCNNFKDWKLEKEHDIFIFGNTSPHYYQFRNRLVKLLNKNKDEFNIVQWESIKNYFKFDPRVSNKNLSKMINKSWLTVSTTSNYNMLLGKYFEIAMSGSVVLGNMPDEGKIVFLDNYIEITPNMLDEEILDAVRKALSNKEKLKQICDLNAQKFTQFDLKYYSDRLFERVCEASL